MFLPFLFKIFIYGWARSSFLLGLCLVSESGGCALVVRRLLIAVASLVEEPRPCLGCRASSVVAPGFQSTESVVAALGLICSMAGGISLVQIWNLCLLHQQVDSLPPSRQGSPLFTFY